MSFVLQFVLSDLYCEKIDAKQTEVVFRGRLLKAIACTELQTEKCRQNNNKNKTRTNSVHHEMSPVIV